MFSTETQDLHREPKVARLNVAIFSSHAGISRFFGIVVAMYFNDHRPAHFHTRSGAHKAKYQLDPLMLQEGELPPRVERLVLEWARNHREELLECFEAVMNHQPPGGIPPLR